MRSWFLLLAALPLPALAQTHEPLTTAIAGRSPHVAMREIARRDPGCDQAVRASVPGGKLAHATARDARCAADARLAARRAGGRSGTGE